MKLYKIIFLLLGCFFAFGTAKHAINSRNTIRRLEANQRALIDKATYYRTRDSLSAASVEQLAITHATFKRHYDDLVAEAENLNLKVRRLEAASRTVTETVYHIITEWRDSIVYRDGRIDTLRCATWIDPFITFEMCDNEAHIAITDTLIQFVHRVPRINIPIPQTQLNIMIGTKAIRQEVTTKNPHTEIVYTEYIRLIK